MVGTLSARISAVNRRDLFAAVFAFCFVDVGCETRRGPADHKRSDWGKRAFGFPTCGTGFLSASRPAPLALGIARGQTVAEIGAGGGYLTRHLAQAVGPSGKVVATDIDKAALAALRSRMQAAFQVETRLVPRDASGLELSRYDVIVLADVVHLLPQPDRYLPALFPSLRPGGHLYVVGREDRMPGLAQAAMRAGLQIRPVQADLPAQFVIELFAVIPWLCAKIGQGVIRLCAMLSHPQSTMPFPIPCGGHDYTHPGHLAMLATLFGLSAPPVATCRVLELGCGDGSNLIPMALAMPNATFVGIDLSARHIETGQQEASQLGISNLSLRHQDLLTFGDGEQPFDYIIGHGIYSWVPEAVRSKIWDICSNLLSPHGVAYLSYNTYPGWHQRKMVRDMMRFHTQRLDDPDRRRAQALAMVNFIAGGGSLQFPLHRKALETELARLTELPRNYILHDDLGEINQPYYFHEFITAATAHGLQFLSETRFHVMQDNRLSPEARNTLRQVGDLLVMEQYRDYITCSAFRETLICHATRSLERRIQPSQMERFSFQSSLRSQSAQPDVVHAVDEKFQSDGMTLSLSEPIAKAALVIMQQNAPKAIPFETLFADSLRLCRADSQADFDLRFRMNQRQELSELLLAGFGAGVIRPTLFGSFLSASGRQTTA